MHRSQVLNYELCELANPCGCSGVEEEEGVTVEAGLAPLVAVGAEPFDAPLLVGAAGWLPKGAAVEAGPPSCAPPLLGVVEVPVINVVDFFFLVPPTAPPTTAPIMIMISTTMMIIPFLVA